MAKLEQELDLCKKRREKMDYRPQALVEILRTIRSLRPAKARIVLKCLN